MKKSISLLMAALATTTFTTMIPSGILASSHMDAPLITLDPSANTTDVYAFVSQIQGVKYLTVALSVYPFEEPGIGPNNFRFDDNVLYEIHLAQGKDLPGNSGAAKAASPSVSYQVKFRTTYKKTDTIAQAFGGVIASPNDGAQNMTQRY